MRQRRFAKLTWLRAERLTHGFILAETALKAGIPHGRASETERDPDNARPEDVAALRRAIAELVAERQEVRRCPQCDLGDVEAERDLTFVPDQEPGKKKP